MNCYIDIHNGVPGLLPWGYFQIMLKGIKLGLDINPQINRQEVFSEWLYELNLENVSREAFNSILEMIDENVKNLEKNDISDRFKKFWDEEFIPILINDVRYDGVCSKFEF